MCITCTECLDLKKNWMSRFAKIRWEIVFIFYTEFLDLQKNWISQTRKIHRKIVYITYVRNVWICRKIECPELRKFNGKLCTLFMYGMSRFAKKFKVQNSRNSIWNCVQYLYGMFGFAEKMHIQNCENSTENCVHYICTKCLDLQKIWLSRIA